MLKDENNKPLPKVMVGITKKLKKLTLTKGENVLELDIVDGEIDLIELDVWISDVLYHVSKEAPPKSKFLL